MKLVTLFLLLCVCLLTISATPQSRTWEYKFEYRCSDKKANDLGTQGWELVGFANTTPGNGDFAACVFKRPR